MVIDLRDEHGTHRITLGDGASLTTTVVRPIDVGDGTLRQLVYRYCGIEADDGTPIWTLREESEQ